uniref:wall-associated receptor kinase-like 8 n=1 Tax=Fragaria vesca subsp. vesca TaxID=101020 RepID=UPI0005CA1EC3|nr:PREDICTED: wall-associated receptor kinase-like 8 [Fragaria vesca subsp. vesca]
MQLLSHMSIMLLLYLSITVLVSGANPPQIASPNCPDRCGNVRIPYPFGVESSTSKGAGCSLDLGFVINCYPNETAVLRLEEQEVQVLDISIEDRTIRVNNFVAKYCQGDGYTSHQPPKLSGTPFTYSQRHNTFVSASCDLLAVVYESDDNPVILGGCSSVCGDETTHTNSTSYLECKTSTNCCQTNLPPNRKSLFFHLLTTAGEGANCSTISSSQQNKHAYLVDQIWFQNLSNSSAAGRVGEKDLEEVPLVLEWAINDSFTQFNESNYPSTDSSSCQKVLAYKLQSTFICSCSAGYEGNPYLGSQFCSDIDECTDRAKNHCSAGEKCVNLEGSYRCKKESKAKIYVLVGLAACLGTVLLLLVGFLGYRKWKKWSDSKLKRKNYERHGGLLLEQQLLSGNVNVERIKVFESKELEKSTNNYSRDRILGKGGQGTVYKGMLADGRIVAVKRSNIVDEGEVGQFINEIVILSQVSHRNVVKLLGCCLETKVPLLVYEFILNGTLSHYIQHHNEEFPLTWEVRLRVAIEVAGAISYLHSSASSPIYHRDIKSSNILLDGKFRAKVADFGTSRSVAIGKTHRTMTKVQGTFGYLDPEYFQSSQFTDKSDVYSFGVVLAELLTGRKPIFQRTPQEPTSLATYFLESMDQTNLSDILDDQVVNDGSKEEIVAVANLAKRCLNLNGRRRPTMKEVAVELEGIQLSVKGLGRVHGLSEVGSVPTDEITEAWDVDFESTRSCEVKGTSTSSYVQPLLFSNTM